MVYSHKFVLCVLVNGKPVEELANGEVQIPFNTEYVLRFRNKNDRRAVVKFWIDGELVSGSGGYAIPSNDYIDIKRHNNRDASFILVPLNSGEAVDAGKNGPNYDKQKGVVKAEFTLEKKFEPVREIHHYYERPRMRKFIHDPCQGFRSMNYDNSSESISSSDSIYGGPTMDCCMLSDATPASNDVASFKRISLPEGSVRKIIPQSSVQDGCTVEGNMTGQTFGSVYVNLEDTSTTLQIFLRGYDIGKDFPYEPVRIPHNDLQTENELLKLQLEEAKKKKSLEKENERLRKEIQEVKKKKALKKENERLRKELEIYQNMG